MSEILSTIAGYVADLGVDAGKSILKNKYDEKKLRASLISYTERQQKFNEICSLAEEIDFQGLLEYIKNTFIDEVCTRISSVKKKDREIARQNIIDAAVAYSKADTLESRMRVSRSIAICLDIMKGFYKKKIDIQNYILASEIVDEVKENTDRIAESVKTEIIEKIEESTGSLYSMDSLVIQAKNGNLSEVNDRIKKLFEGISTAHPLQPYYGYRMKNDDMISQPLIPEAFEKYPIRYKFTGPVRVGGRYISDPSLDILNYAYRHQLQLVMEVEEAQKYLGDIIDPVQFETQKLVGGELHANPPEFPPAFACSLNIKDQVFYEYVLIRAQEILDDGTCIFSNREQTNTHLHFELRVTANSVIENAEGEATATTGNTGIRIGIQNATIPEILRYLKFIRVVINEKDIRVHVLENDLDLVAGKIDVAEYKTSFKDIDEKIDFLERICDIENYFNLTMEIEGQISEKEYNTIILISELIRNDEIEARWDNVSFTGVVDERFRKNLIEKGSQMGAISYVGNSNIDIFGVHLELKFMITFYDAVIEDHERIIKLAELSKDGDPIKITFKAGENNKVISTLNIPENMTMDKEKLSKEQFAKSVKQCVQEEHSCHC